MMPSFDYDRAATLEDALEALAQGGKGTHLLAGGTDLLQLLKDGVRSADRLVDITGLAADLAGVAPGEGGTLRIGALTPLAEVAVHPLIRSQYRALAQAAELSASPQLRNMATLGGNLLQQTRCDYFRNNVPCYLNGGEKCYAAEGDNRLHSIFPRGVSVSVNPSDPATALVALDAQVELLNTAGQRYTEPVAARLKDPEHDDSRFFRLDADEMIVGLNLPAQTLASVFVKAMQRQAWSFALASVAAAVSTDAQGVVTDARIVLGGVAGQPRRDKEAEAALRGQRLTETTIRLAAERTATTATPLALNAYKVDLVRGLVREALHDLQKRAEQSA